MFFTLSAQEEQERQHKGCQASFKEGSTLENCSFHKVGKENGEKLSLDKAEGRSGEAEGGGSKVIMNEKTKNCTEREQEMVNWSAPKGMGTTPGPPLLPLCPVPWSSR